MIKTRSQLALLGILASVFSFSAGSRRIASKSVKIFGGGALDMLCDENYMATSTLRADISGKEAAAIQGYGMVSMGLSAKSVPVLSKSAGVIHFTPAEQEKWKEGWDISVPELANIDKFAMESAIAMSLSMELTSALAIVYDQNGERLSSPISVRGKKGHNITFIAASGTKGILKKKTEEGFRKITTIYQILYFDEQVGRLTDVASASKYYVLPPIHLKHI